MPSTLIVEVCEVAEKRPIPNADRLELLIIKGWEVVAQKDLVRVGDKVIYLPPESMITEAYASKLGILKYVSPVPFHIAYPAESNRGEREDLFEKWYRVRACRLRGQPSYGTIDHDVPEDWEVGKDVAELLDVRKWEPPPKCTDGDAERDHTRFHKYTDIENINHFPDVIAEGEEVVFTEKLHGMNGRWGRIIEADPETGELVPTLMAGSHNYRRKPPSEIVKPSLFWQLMDDRIKALFDLVINDHGPFANIIVFYEALNTQKGFAYGDLSGRKFYRVFDIAVNGLYLSHDFMLGYCAAAGVPTVPVLYRGPFSMDVLRQHTNGPTTMCGPEGTGKFKGREGLVVKPIVERFGEGRLANKRVIFKAVSADYLDYKTGKGGDDVDISDA
jgi:RNA ligase (TIGR02306 family)